jgi:hypothetical protein
LPAPLPDETKTLAAVPGEVSGNLPAPQ